MTHEKLKQAFMQGEEREAAKLFQELLRQSVRAGLFATMAEEVDALCGPRYRPDSQSVYQRAGSEIGVAYLDGSKESIRRPRVRHETGGEVRLASYEAVVAAVAQGLSVRGVERAMDKAVSKSTVSRMWAEKSREQLELLRNRLLSDTDWLAVLIDGVWLTREQCVVVAIGIDIEGNKQVLDFEQGPSENITVVTELIKRLAKRGMRANELRRLLVLRDGSEAIAAAVKRMWPEALQQECLVHAQSNLRDKLRRCDRADLDLRFKVLREAQGSQAGEEAFNALLDFVSERNAAAALVLRQRKESLLTFHRLNVPSTLNITFLSTNLIENVLRNWREATGNIKRWNEKDDMISRWMASGLLWAEAGFRKVRGHEDLPSLAEALSTLGATRPKPPQADVSLTTPATF
jgi:transposase-like protein